MNPNTYNTKYNFVKNDLGRCVSAMIPQVAHMEFRLGGGLYDPERELVTICLAEGVRLTVDVTGKNLWETAQAVFDALCPYEPAC